MIWNGVMQLNTRTEQIGKDWSDLEKLVRSNSVKLRNLGCTERKTGGTKWQFVGNNSRKMTWNEHVCLRESYFLVLLGNPCLLVNYVLIETFHMGVLTQDECFWTWCEFLVQTTEKLSRVVQLGFSSMILVPPMANETFKQMGDASGVFEAANNQLL